MSSPIRTAFISAPSSADLTTLRQLLRDRDIAVVSPGDASASSSYAADIGRAIEVADLVIGVITNDPSSQWSLFELGQAFAKSKPILVVLSGRDDFIPSDITRLIYLRADLDNNQAIGFALDQMQSARMKGTAVAEKPVSSKKSECPLGWRAEEFLHRVRAYAPGREQNLEKLVVDALHMGGVGIVSERGVVPSRVDLAVWSDSLQSHVGNPLLIEIKAKIETTAQLRRVFDQLSTAVVSAGTRWGLLLYAVDRSALAWELKQAPPNVLVVSLTSLLTRMKTQTFSDVIRELRNQRVHGASY